MSNRLIDFLIAMGEDLSLQHQYREDPEKVMSEHSLSNEDKAALLSGDERLILRGQHGKDDVIIYKLILVIPKPRRTKAPSG
jgi:hypothetical protein